MIAPESTKNRPLINCDQEGCSAKVKDIRSHTKKIHGKIILLTCNQMDCNVKVEHMKGLKRHLAVIHGGGIRYICKLEKCNFETHSKKYLVKHEKKHPVQALNMKRSQNQEKN